MKIIVVVISPQGETKLETTGFAGAECREASRSIERALGEPAAEQLTSEFYTQPIEQSQQREEA